MILLSRENDGGAILWTYQHLLRVDHFPSFRFDFFSREFAACVVVHIDPHVTGQRHTLAVG